MAANEVKILVSADTKQAEQSLSGMSGKLQSMAPKLKMAGAALTGFAVAGVGLGAAFVAAANKVDQAMAVIQSGTGATGKQLADLEGIFKTVVATVPVDFDNAANAIGDLNTRLGLTGTELEKTVVVALEAGKALGVDTASLIKTTTGAMNAFGVAGSEASSIMDQLFVASQKTGVPIGNLSVALQSYGPVMKNLGFSLTETTALFGQLDKVGIEVSRVMPGINAFMRRLAAEGVEDLRGGLDDVIKEMQNAVTDTEALNIATEAFGAEGAQRLLVAVKEGAFNIDTLAGSLKDSQGAVIDNAEATRTLSDRMGLLKTNVQLAAAPIGEKLMAALEKLLPHIEKLFKWLGDLDPQFVTIAAVVGGAAVALAGIAGPILILIGMLPALQAGFLLLSASMGPITLAIIGIAAAIAAGIVIWKNWDAIVEFISSTFNSKWAWLLPGGPLIKAILFLKDNWETIWKGIKDTFEGITDKMKSLGEDMVDGLIEGLLNPIKKVKDASMTVGKAVLDPITSFFGISSPSALMRDRGMEIGAGLANGLELSEPWIAAAARKLTNTIDQNLGGLGLFGDIGQMGMEKADIRKMSLLGQFDVFMAQHAEKLQLSELAKTKKGGDLVLQMMQRVNATSPEWNFTLEEMTEKLEALGDKATETAVAVGRSFQNMDADLHKYMDTLTGEMAAIVPVERRTFNPRAGVPGMGAMSGIHEATTARLRLQEILAQRGDDLPPAQRTSLEGKIDELLAKESVFARSLVVKVNLDGHELQSAQAEAALLLEAVTGS